MNEQLIVKNFGPIKDATVDFKRVTVFIGPTGGGKSTLAKLAAIFRDDDWQREPDLNFKQSIFKESLNSQLIFDYLKDNGIVNWYAPECEATYDAEGLKHNNEKREILLKTGSDIFNRIGAQIESSEPFHIFNYATEKERLAMSIMHGKTIDVFYIPADRSFVAAVDSGLAGLVLKDIALPESLLAFLNQFKLAQNWLQIFPLEIPFLDISYRMVDRQPQIDLGEDGTIDLARGASGIQAVTPMMLVINHTISRRRDSAKEPHSFIIEEPELNLYPTAQQGLLNWLVEKCTQGENDLTITTHSPYILSHLNLLLYAYQVAEKHPDRADEVAELVPRASWINPKEFACYQVENGGVTSLVSEELGLIDDNGLDNLSGDAADAFDNLIRLSKGVARK